MHVALVELDPEKRALRTIQAPEQVGYDPGLGRWAPTSSAFRPQSDGSISVDLEEVQELDSVPLEHGYPRVRNAVGLIAHKVGRLTTDGYLVSHVPELSNDYHGEARGKPSSSKRGNLAQTCEIIVPINGSEAQRLLDEKLAREAQKALSINL